MLELLNSLDLEVFGAASVVILLLAWLALYFKGQAEQARSEKDRMVQKQSEEKQEQLETLKATLRVLRAQLDRVQEGKNK